MFRSIAKDIKNDAGAIQQFTTEIKRDTEEILEEIQRLQRQLPNDWPLDEGRIQLEAWLDNLTQYTETQYAGTVADGETVDEINTLIPVGHGKEKETRVTVQSVVPVPSIQITQDDVNDATPPIELKSSDPREDNPNGSRSTPSPRASPVGLGSGNASSQLIITVPCTNRVVSIDGNAERQICAALHDDGVVRVCSIETKQVLRELRSSIQISSATRLAICPANPDILIIQGYRKSISKPGNLNIEGWYWAEGRKINISIDITFTSAAGYYFVPCSTAVYTRTTEGHLIIIDLDSSLKECSMGQEVPLSEIASSAMRCIAPNRGYIYKVRFASDKGIVLVWKKQKTSLLRRLVPKLCPRLQVQADRADDLVQVARLSSVDPEGRKASIIERYGPSVIKDARITSKFWLRNGPPKIGLKLLRTKRIALIFTALGEGRRVSAMKFDTGEGVYVYDYPRDWQAYHVQEECIVFMDAEGKRRVISLTDWRELATYDTVGLPLFGTADAFISARQTSSAIEFWKTQKPRALQGDQVVTSAFRAVSGFI